MKMCRTCFTVHHDPISAFCSEACFDEFIHRTIKREWVTEMVRDENEARWAARAGAIRARTVWRARKPRA